MRNKSWKFLQGKIKKFWATIINPFFLSRIHGWEIFALYFLKFLTQRIIKKFWATIINPFFRSAILAKNFFVLNFLKFFTRKDKKDLSYDYQPIFSFYILGSEIFVLNFLKFFTRWMIKKIRATVINPFFRHIFLALNLFA